MNATLTVKEIKKNDVQLDDQDNVVKVFVKFSSEDNRTFNASWRADNDKPQPDRKSLKLIQEGAHLDVSYNESEGEYAGKPYTSRWVREIKEASGPAAPSNGSKPKGGEWRTPQQIMRGEAALCSARLLGDGPVSMETFFDTAKQIEQYITGDSLAGAVASAKAAFPDSAVDEFDTEGIPF